MLETGSDGASLFALAKCNDGKQLPPNVLSRPGQTLGVLFTMSNGQPLLLVCALGTPSVIAPFRMDKMTKSLTGYLSPVAIRCDTALDRAKTWRYSFVRPTLMVQNQSVISH
jgi:hypothetical protein